MTQEEVNKAFEELKKDGMDDNDLLVALGKMYQDGEITKDQLGALIYELGYEFTDEFASKPEGEDKDGMFEESDEGEEGEGEGEGKDAEDKAPEDEEPKDGDDEGDDDKDGEGEGESEEEERAKAMHLFGR